MSHQIIFNKVTHNASKLVRKIIFQHPLLEYLFSGRNCYQKNCYWRTYYAEKFLKHIIGEIAVGKCLVLPRNLKCNYIELSTNGFQMITYPLETKNPFNVIKRLGSGVHE
ncbi:hypothetical protein Glove_50g128 [Diversispora epigaea]|uniref:Uncharacterized protein n=1 Tax=Diversispora epigaea TaxID=1348612 RepID=A0A397JKH1_9GLOM|nr:hypothetical protein Glove_50g128 [Diversispora epigaea]